MNCCVVGQRRERGALIVVTIHFVSLGLVAGAGERQLGRREAWSGRAEVGVGVLGRGVLRRARRQQSDLVNHVLHLVRERLGRTGWRRGVARVHLGVRVSAELGGRAEALARARTALERRLHHADHAARRLPPRVARACLVRLQRRRRRERHLAVLAHVAKIEVEFACAGWRLGGGWR